jgi:hypothetical protein
VYRSDYAGGSRLSDSSPKSRAGYCDQPDCPSKASTALIIADPNGRELAAGP